MMYKIDQSAYTVERHGYLDPLVLTAQIMHGYFYRLKKILEDFGTFSPSLPVNLSKYMHLLSK